MSSPQAVPAQVADANDLRGQYFGLLIRKPLTMVLLVAFAIAGGIAGLALVGPVIGLAGLGAALAVGLIVVFGIADSRSEDVFFAQYAAARQMTDEGGRRHLPEGTPRPAKGDDRYAVRMLEGPLGEGVDGILALFTYEERSTDSQGNQDTRVGYEAAALLDRLMRGKRAPVRPVYVEPTGVVTRLSSDALAVGDRDVATALTLIHQRACSGSLTVRDGGHDVSLSYSTMSSAPAT